jgi:hypothetical protein
MRTHRIIAALLAAVGLLGLAVAGWSVALPATAGATAGTTCTGELAPGTYHKLVVPDDAFCFSEGPITVRRGLRIGEGATFVLGSEDNPVDTGTINGGVQATNPASVQIHFTTINGGINIQGGSGPFGGPFDITWNAIEDNVIHGDVTIEGYNGFWFGFIPNTASGSVNLNNNVLVDPDANEYVTNTIHGNLNCSGNSPAPQVGDSQGSPNVVTGNKTGQCVVL